MRTPRGDEGELTKVIDVSADDDQEPDSEGEYTGASLTKPGMPPDLTVCAAFRTEVWTTVFQSTLLFQWKGEDGKKWGYITLFAWETGTFYDIVFGNVIRYYVKGEKVYFPFVWACICASLDTASGSLVLLVDGKVVLEERSPGSYSGGSEKAHGP